MRIIKVLLCFTIIAAIVTESSCQKIIYLTYRPPVTRRVPPIRQVRDVLSKTENSDKIENSALGLIKKAQIVDDIRDTTTENPLSKNIRVARSAEKQILSLKQQNGIILSESTDAEDKFIKDREIRSVSQEEPFWLYKGNDVIRASGSVDDPNLPRHLDDIKTDSNRRYTRSVDSPSAKRGGGSSGTSGSRGGTGPTHPGYNRRNSRDLRLPILPKPWKSIPSPVFPTPLIPYSDSRRFPIYARQTRDIHIPGMKKPSYQDVVIPNWNPNIRTSPWQSLGRNKH